MKSKRFADRKAHSESLDVAFWLHPEQLTRSASRARLEVVRSGGRAPAPAQRAGEILHVIASALDEIPFGLVDGIEIRRITDLTLETDTPLDAPVEVRARAIGTRELAGGHRLVTVCCQLTSQFGDFVAAFSAEVEARAEAAIAPLGAGGMIYGVATPEPDLECVDNIPV